MQLPVKLFASAFVDADGDAHEASQWIIQNASGGIVYSGSFDAAGKTSFTVPSGTLQANTKYYWQVIYRDDRGVCIFSFRPDIVYGTGPGRAKEAVLLPLRHSARPWLDRWKSFGSLETGTC